ncbi:MAG: glycosyltransferase [Parvularculaceae bacterium]
MRSFRICFLGPETPALSQTFVYREALALQRRGHYILPVTIRKPKDPAGDVEELGPVITLYDCDKSAYASAFFKMFLQRPVGALKASLMLVSDFIASIGEGRFKPALLFHYLAGFRLAALMRDERIEHLHVHFAHFPAQIGMYASAISGTPFTATAHANDIFENALLLKRKAKRAAALFMISDYNRHLLEQAGVDPQKMQVVRCGVPDRKRSAPRPQHGVRPFRIGSLGRLVEKKGMATTIRAAAALAKAGADVRLEIVGDGPLRESLQEEINELGLSGCAVLLGAMPNSKVMEWLESLHLLVMSCEEDRNGDKDGIPVAMMEAMALGVPVVSTRLSGIPELVVDRTSGLLGEPKDVESIAGAIAEMMNDETFYDRICAGAKARVEEEFSEAVNIERLEKAIEAAVRR